MASASEDYLPDLAKVFAREASVFSWQSTLRALILPSRGTTDHVVISSSRARDLVSQKVPSFPPPSAPSQSIFEAKTAAISIPPGAASTYDIAQIKGDAKWLSTEIAISEDEALRVAVLEWEQRPTQRLLSGYSEAELASLKDCFQHENANIDFSRLFIERSDTIFETEQERRRRVLLISFREKAGLLGVSRELQQIALLPDSADASFDPLKELALDVDQTSPTDPGVTDLLDALEHHLRALDSGRTWTISQEDVPEIWVASQISSICTLLELLLLRLRGSNASQSMGEIIVRWLRMHAGCEFFATLRPSQFLHITDIERLQAVASLVSLAFLDAASSVASLSSTSTTTNQQSYFLDTEIVIEVQSIMLQATEACVVQAAPVALAWIMILEELRQAAATAKNLREDQHDQKTVELGSTSDTASRRASYSSLQQSIYEDVMDHVVNASPVADPLAYMLRCTIEANHALDVVVTLASLCKSPNSVLSLFEHQILQELLTVSIANIGYSPGLLSAQFALLETSTSDQRMGDLPDATETFVKNEYLTNSFLSVAAARFPYEPLPYLRLCKLLASAPVFDDDGTQYVTHKLRAMTSFTQSATGLYASFHTIREDENLNLVALDHNIDVVAGLNTRLLGYGNEKGNNNAVSMIMSADTVGEVVSDSLPPIIRWQHSFSGMALLGCWLELYYMGQLQSPLSLAESAEDVASEIIGLISILLQSATYAKASSGQQVDRLHLQETVLAEASAGLRHATDISEYIFEIMEQQLQHFRRRPANSFNTSVLVSCMDFLASFSYVRPEQFWSFIAKSGLLDFRGTDGLLLAIISGIEAPSQSFAVLESSSKLYDCTISVALQRPRSPGAQNGVLSSRRPAPQSTRLQASILLAMTRFFHNIFETSPDWTFASSQQQLQIVTSISDAFQRIILYAGGVGDDTTAFTQCFKSSARFLDNQFNLQSELAAGGASIIRQLMVSMDLGEISTRIIPFEHSATPSASLVALSQALTKSNKIHGRQASSLQLQLFYAIPLIVRVYVTETATASVTLQLVEAVLDSMGTDRPVSLLGHLGSCAALSLLETLQDNEHVTSNPPLQCAIWQLLAKFVQRNQQWMALLILTGSPPSRDKNTLGGAATSLRGRSFLDIAIEKLTRIKELPPSVSSVMLAFIIQAQENWSWTADSMSAKKNLFPALISHIRDAYIDPSATLQLAYRNKIASQITELATTHLHYTKALRDNQFATTITSLIHWLAENAIEVRMYNSSLHGNLRKNFASRFTGMKLIDFKRTRLNDVSYGDSYYYDLQLADQILCAEPYWTSRAGSQDQTFYAEIQRANRNLSAVESELALLRSLHTLCIEHSSWLISRPLSNAQSGGATKESVRIFIDIVESCLKANSQHCPPLNLFDNLFQSRADLVLVLLQKLVDTRTKGFEAKNLLKTAWDCTQFKNSSYDQAIANNDLSYWRSCLSIVLMALQFHVGGKWVPPAFDQSPANLLRYTVNDQIPTILDLVTIIVGQGLKSIVSAIQDMHKANGIANDLQSAVVSHKDVALVLSILETILRMSRVPEFVSEASERLIATGVIDTCLLLYSWSHTLTEPEFEDKPIYADYALQLLTCLSSLPPVVEEMAVEGVLSRFLTARITQRLQNVPDGATHVDQRPQCQFLYGMWADGLLPVCLNLLHTVGAPVAAEVSVFLCQFPNQLSRASTAFIPVAQSNGGNSNVITLSCANESVTLALISFILQSFRNAGASAAVDPVRILSLVGYDEHKKALAEDLNDLVNIGVVGIQGRVMAINEKESGLMKTDTEQGNMLVSRIYQDLKHASVCLKEQENDTDHERA